MAEAATKEAPAASSAAQATAPQSASSGAGQAQTATQTAAQQAYEFGGKKYASVDELGKAYESAQSELGKWTQAHGDLKRQYDDASRTAQQWSDWWKNVQPLWGDDVEKVLRQKLMQMTGQGQPQQAQAQPQHAANGFEGYELLQPEQQAQRVRDAIMAELAPQYQQQVKTLQDQWLNHLAQREQYYQQYLTNHLGLMRRALEEKVKNPSFDVDAVMEQAARAIGGQIDPLTLGQQLLTAASYESRLDAEKKKMYEQAKQDFELAEKNKKIEGVPAGTGAAPTYKLPAGVTPAANGKNPGLGSLRERAAEAIYKNFGPQWFRNE